MRGRVTSSLDRMDLQWLHTASCTMLICTYPYLQGLIQSVFCINPNALLMRHTKVTATDKGLYILFTMSKSGYSFN